MKTLGVLLLLALGLGAAFWTTQRPGQGVEALQQDAQLLRERVNGAVDALRGRVQATLPVEDPAAATDSAATQAPITDSAVDSATTDVLGTRIDALENELTRTLSVAESSSVLDRLDALDARLDAAASLAGAPDSGAGERATLAQMEQRLAAIDPTTRLDALDQRIDSALDSLTSLNERLAAREQAQVIHADRQSAEQAALAQRLDTTNARLATLVAVPLTDPTETDPAGGVADGVAADGDAPIDSPAGALPRGIDAALDARLVALEEAMADGRAADTRQSAALSRLESAIDALSTDSRALSIDSVQQQIRDQLSSLDAEMADSPASGDVRELTDSLASTRQRLGELETQVEDLPDSARVGDRVQENQSALQQQVAALQERIEQLGERDDPALISGLDAVRAQVDQLSASGFVTQEELRQQAQGKHVEYKIYFDKNSIQVSDEAARVLDSFIAQETNRTTGVAIFGFTDRQGSAIYNQQLAQRRAASVRSYLIQNGFDYTKIGNVAGLGEDAAAALLEDNEEDAQQRVVVLFASQL